MKTKNILNENLLLIPQTEPQILPTAGSEAKAETSPSELGQEAISETDEAVDEEIEEEVEVEVEVEVDEEVEESAAPPPTTETQNVTEEVEVATEKEKKKEQDAKEESGFDPPLYITNQNEIGETSVPRNLGLPPLSDFVIKLYIPTILQQAPVEDICCVKDQPIHLTYNGILIYTGENRIIDRETSYEYSSEKGGCDDCCCEVPPPPEPNYWFTYTNCDGEAYIDLYIEKQYCYSEDNYAQAYYGEGSYSYCGNCETNSTYGVNGGYGENGNGEGFVEHYRLQFLPGFEPECGCDIVSVNSNVLKASSIEDFVDYFITGAINIGGEQNGDFETFVEGLYYATHFEDTCGVCWSLVNFGYGEVPALNGYGYDNSNPYYLIPVCASPIEFDTICSYNVEERIYDDESPLSDLYLYANDGYYSYTSNFYTGGDTYDSYTIEIDVNMAFIEIMGNSLVAFNFDLYASSYYSGDYGSGSNNVTLLVDVPDTMGYDSSYIDNFILCNEKYFEDFFSYVIKNSGQILDNVRDNDQLSDADALSLATYVMRTYALNTDYPSSFPKVAGVLEDTSNDAFGLSFTGGSITTSAFTQAPFNFEDVYLTNIQLTNPEDANIVKTELEISYCGDSIIQRFEEFQQASGCESTYGDPRAYIEQYVDAYFVEQGSNRYLEINYAVPVYDASNGWSEGTIETFRVCVDDNVKIDEMCINAQALFENYYNYGYVNFGSLLTYEEPVVFFKNDFGDCYNIEYAYSNGEGEGEVEESNMNCEYELAPCECKVEINAQSINNNENVSAYNNTIYITNYDNNTSHYYYLNFYFVQDENGSSIKIDYTYYGGSNEITECKQIEIQNATLDCCCPIESLVVDENDLNNFVTSYLNEYDGQYVTLDQFLYYFSEEGNLNFYDCDDNCYNFNITYEGESEPTTYSVEPCDEESCCKSDIEVEYLPPVEEPMPEPTIAVAGVEETCFDQFFDFNYINCNGLSYIDFTWYYNNYPASDCFKFPVESNNILISVPDDISISYECQLTLVIPPISENEYNQFFQDCCNLSESVYSETGDQFIQWLFCDRALLESSCGNNYIIDKTCNGDYTLVQVDNVVRTTTHDDENAFASISTTGDFQFDLNYATSGDGGNGLSLREAIILANVYGSDIDTILLENGTYNLEILGSGENQSYTGDLDVFTDLQIIGGCEGSTIDANDIDRVFQVGGSEGDFSTLTLRGLTVQNGSVTDENGGGVYINPYSNLVLDNATIQYCTTYIAEESEVGPYIGGYGGGVYAYDNNQITLKDCSSILYNSSGYGGGIYDASASNIYLQGDSNVNGNYATDYGGGIFGTYNTYIQLMDDSSIVNNQSPNGGGIYIQSDGLLQLNDTSSITNNIASNDGGGVYTYQSTVELYNNSDISSNTAENNGGGILTYQSTITLNDASFISYNQADNGGGIFDYNFSFIDLPAGESSTISGNSASNNGDGVYTNGGTVINDPDNRITDTIFPVVLDLNHDGNVSLISAAQSQVSWDVYGDGVQHKTGWVGPEDGILVYDKDGDKKVTDISEFMLSSYHPDAKTDLEGLILAFDSNHDLVFNMNDDHYTDFGVWQDVNSDGKTDQGEFFSLADLDIESISLLSDHVSSIQEGNTIFGSSTYKTTGGEYRLADVGLAVGEPVLSMNDVINPQDTISNLSSSASSLPVQNNCASCEPVVVEQVCPPPIPVQSIEEQPVICVA